MSCQVEGRTALGRRLEVAARLASTLFLLVLSLLSLPAVLVAQTADAGLEADLAQMMEWFAGEFDNYAQVQEEKQAAVRDAGPAQPHEWIHSIFSRVDLPAFGDHVFYVEQYGDGDPGQIYRNRLYVFSLNEEEKAIELAIHSFPEPEAVYGAHRKPELLAGLTPETAPAIEGCEVYWRRAVEGFAGSTKEGACRIVSAGSGKTLIVSDDLRLIADELWIRDRAVDEEGNWVLGNRDEIPHMLQRSHNFTCWAAVRRGDSEDAWLAARDLVIHDLGGQGVLGSADEEAPAYTIELAQKDQDVKGRWPSLRMTVREKGKDQSLAYTWTDPAAERIGMNLGWFRSGCAREPTDP